MLLRIAGLFSRRCYNILSIVAAQTENTEYSRILIVVSGDDRIIRQLDKQGFDAIVMAQVSMRALLPDLKDVRTPLLCSFFSGYSAVADKLNEIARQDDSHKALQ